MIFRSVAFLCAIFFSTPALAVELEDVDADLFTATTQAEKMRNEMGTFLINAARMNDENVMTVIKALPQFVQDGLKLVGADGQEANLKNDTVNIVLQNYGGIIIISVSATVSYPYRGGARQIFVKNDPLVDAFEFMHLFNQKGAIFKVSGLPWEQSIKKLIPDAEGCYANHQICDTHKLYTTEENDLPKDKREFFSGVIKAGSMMTREKATEMLQHFHAKINNAVIASGLESGYVRIGSDEELSVQ